MSTPVDQLVQVARLRLALVRLARRIRQRSDAGLSPSQLSALSTIERHGPLRLGELADRERIGKSSVTRLAAKLETGGHITRITDVEDRRSHLVDLTERGGQLLAAANDRADAFLKRQIAGLTPEEQRLLAVCVPVLERLLTIRR